MTVLPTFVVRPAGAGDLGWVGDAEVETAALSYGDAATVGAARRAAALARGVEAGDVHVVEGDGVVVGYFWVEERDGDGYLVDLYVIADRRGTGAADHVLGFAVAACARRGWTQLRMVVADRNERAVRFLRRAGAVGGATTDGLREHVLAVGVPP